MATENPDNRDDSLRWYGRRHGHKLRRGRRGLMETVLPAVRFRPAAEGGPVDPLQAFPMPASDVWLEIGFGAGHHLEAQAAAHPDVAMIGCEPFVNGVARLLSAIDATGIGNIRIFDDDARLLLGALPDASIGRVFILFPDPWPKKRHHKRRFISTGNLDSLSRILKDGGELRFASDHMDYVRWTLDHVTRHPDFHWLARSPRDWRAPPPDWFETRYEAKARKDGLACAYLCFRRRPRSP